MKVFVMLCYYILLLYLPLPVTCDGAKPAIPENNVAVRDNSEVQNRNIQESALMKTYNDVVKRGNQLKDQYGPIISSVASWVYSKSQNWISPTKVITSIPVIKFAMDHIAPANGKNGIEVDVFGEKVNLEKTLQHPELIKPLFSVENAGKVAVKSMELMVDPKVTAAVDAFIREVKDKSIDKDDNGNPGINGEALFNAIQESPNISTLFPQKETNDKLQYAIKLLDSFCVDGSKPKKSGVVSKEKEISNQNGKDEKDISNGIPKTKSNDSSLKKGFSNLAKSVSYVANAGTQMVVRVGKFMLTESMVLSTITCFLPCSYPKNALKFICIVTYIMAKANQEDVMPRIDNDTINRLNIITGVEIGLLLEKLNDQNIMKRLFPMDDESSYAVAILKFIAGSEIVMIDKVIKILREFHAEHVKNKKEFTISDLLKDPKFFKNLIETPEVQQLSAQLYGGKLLNAVTNSSNAFKAVQSPTISDLFQDSTISESLMKMPEITNLNEVVTGDEKQEDEKKINPDINEDEILKRDISYVAAAYAAITKVEKDKKDEEEASELPSNLIQIF